MYLRPRCTALLSVKGVVQLHIRRLQSTKAPLIQKLTNELEDQNKMTAYQNILTNLSSLEDQPEVLNSNLEVLDQLFEKVAQDQSLESIDRERLHNYVLSKLIKHDSSLSTIHQAHLRKIDGKVTVESLIEILKYNSGRVYSSWEIFEKYYNSLEFHTIEEKDLLFRTVIEKLVKGDSSDHEEEAFRPSEESVAKAIFLLNNLHTMDQDLNNAAFKQALVYKNLELVRYIKLNPALFEVLRELDEESLSNLFCFWSIDNISEEDVDSNLEVIEKTILGLSDPQVSTDSLKSQEKEAIVSELFQKVQNGFYNLRLKQFSAQPLRTKEESFNLIIERVHDKLKSSDPRFRGLKKAYLKAQGMNNVTEDSKTKDIDLSSLQSSVGVVSAYQYVLTGEESHLSRARTELLAEGSLKGKQALILALAFKNIEESLKVFNDSIQSLTRDNSEGISDACFLAESLILASLSQEDREFAYLVHDGVVMNNLVEGDDELGRLKTLFKRYGEIVGEEEENIKPLLKLEVLKALKQLV